MDRRELMLLLAGATTGASALRAQQKPMPVVGTFTLPLPTRNHSFCTRFGRD